MIDLHVHSLLSDGSDEPETLAELAAAVGCSAFALTDHDRLDGIERARRRGAALGVDVVGGTEISGTVVYDVPGVRPVLHLLVYFVEAGEGPLHDELVRQGAARVERNERLVERLRSLGVDLTLEELVRVAGKADGIGRPHVARVLVERGVVGTLQEAFDVWLGKGKPGYVPRQGLDPATAIRLAVASGGVPVLAHPLSLGLAGASFDAAIAELAAFGLQGIECLYGRYRPAERSALEQMARRHDLVVTGGSDYHGTYKPELSLGVGTGDLRVPARVLDDLAARRTSTEKHRQ